MRVAGVHDARSSSVNLRLVVKAGSLDEDSEEVGAAHFVEHLGFRGTRSFENEELHSFVSMLGSAFGPDLNARTSLTETVWVLNLTLSKDTGKDKEKILSALHIFDEWARHIRFAEQDVEAERKVILEEFRMKQDARHRVKNAYWRATFERIGSRIPIGTLDSIKSLSAKTLQRFYHKHYVCENFSIVACGNLESMGGLDGLRKAINELGYFKTPDRNPIERVPFSLPLREPLGCIIQEQEVRDTTFSIDLFKELPVVVDEEIFIKNEVIKRVFTSIIELRLQEISSRESPWKAAGVSTRLAVHDLPVEVVTLTIQSNKNGKHMSHRNDVEILIDRICTELARLARFSIPPEELVFARRKWRRVFKERASQESSHLAAQLSEEFVQFFSVAGRMPEPNSERENKLALQLLSGDHRISINVDDVHSYIEDLLENLVMWKATKGRNTALILQGPEALFESKEELVSFMRGK